MRTLKGIIEARQLLIAENEQKQADYGRWQKTYKAQMQELVEEEALMAGGVDTERLNHGLHVIHISGDYRRYGGEAAGCVIAAKADLATGAKKLKREYFGAKNYAHWTGQRSDHTYGFGPTHGSIVFSIGLTKAARKMELTEQMVEDALYVLANIDKVLDARIAAKVA